MFKDSTGSVEEYIKSLEKFNNQNALNMTSQKMAANGEMRFPHYIHVLASAKFHILLPVCVKRKRFMFLDSTGSVEEYFKSLEKLNNRNSLNMTSQKMAASG